MRRFRFLIVAIVSGLLVSLPLNSQGGILKVGAARIDITPASDALPAKGYSRGIRDHIYVRAIVIDNSVTSAAFISVEIDGIGAGIIPEISKVTGIPEENIVISPTHTHSGIQLPRGNASEVDPNRLAFAKNLEKSIIESVRQAKKSLQPASFGYNTGTAYLNVNRNAIDPITRLWTQAPNYEGPSDKTVAVVTYRSAEGEPIAVFYNYGMHANSSYMSGILTGDAPGEASRYIERYYDNKIVAVYSPSAQGDQNPLYLQPMSDIEKIKSDLALSSGRAKNSEEANKMAGFDGAVDDIADIDPNLYERQSEMISALGAFLGEEVLHVIKYTARYRSDIRISSADTTVTCPGRTRTNFNREGLAATYTDGSPVNIGLKLLVIGDIAYAVMGGDPFSGIKEQLMDEVPFNHTIMVVMSNGLGGGYIPTDDAYGMNTFQVLGSKLKPGCAERAIINGFLDLMDKAWR